MPFDLEAFKAAYAKWVDEGLADFKAGKVLEVVKRYPLVEHDDVPWTPYAGAAAIQTIALVTSGGLYLKGKQTPFDTESIHGDPSFREIPGPPGRRTSASPTPTTITAWPSRTST